MPKKLCSPKRSYYKSLRKGTTNTFVAVEFITEKRLTRVTKERTKKDFALFVKGIFGNLVKLIYYTK